MMAPTHIFAGWTLTGFFLSPSLSVNIMAASTFFALFPDIDTPESFIGHKIPVLPTIINMIIGHRTFTHSLAFLLAGYFLLGFISQMIALAWLFGVGSHIIADILTPHGVQLFWPHPFRVKISAIQTGGITEAVFLLALLFYNFGTEQGQTLWKNVFSMIYFSITSLF